MKTYGSYGWIEINQSRKNILNEFDRVKNITKNRPVNTAHGIAVESYIRNWLEEFLPKKYAVTSGYVIPNVYDFDYKLYHYDLIIYNKLESPVLWMEDNKDNSPQGKSRAIPAKYIAAIYEIKSTFNKFNVKASLEKLNNINNFKEYLPAKFSAGSIFIELKTEYSNQRDILKILHSGNKIFGYWGGVVLRCELDPNIIGVFKYLLDENENDKEGYYPDIDLVKKIDELNIYALKSGGFTVDEMGAGVVLVHTSLNNWNIIKTYGPSYTNKSLTTNLMWSHNGFSEFIIQLISRLEGNVNVDNDRPIFGTVFDTLNTKSPLIQGNEPKKELPITIDPKKNDEGNFLNVNLKNNCIEITIIYVIRNTGYAAAETTADNYKTTSIIDPGTEKVFTEQFPLTESNNDDYQNIVKTLNPEKLIIRRNIEIFYNHISDKNNIYRVNLDCSIMKEKFEYNKITQNSEKG